MTADEKLPKGEGLLDLARDGTWIALAFIAFRAVQPRFQSTLFFYLAVWGALYLTLCLSAVICGRVARGLVYAVCGPAIVALTAYTTVVLVPAE